MKIETDIQVGKPFPGMEIFLKIFTLFALFTLFTLAAVVKGPKIKTSIHRNTKTGSVFKI